MWDTLSKGMIFRGSAQDLLTENHTSFKKYLMLGNPSPFLKKKYRRVSQALTSASTRKGYEQKNWHARTGQLIAALWVNAASEDCFYQKELQPLSADSTLFWLAPWQMPSQSLWPLPEVREFLYG